jgi:hypothetical protein
MPPSEPKFIFVSFQDNNDRVFIYNIYIFFIITVTYPNIFMTKLCIEKGAFENASPFNALTSNNFLVIFK